MMDEEAAEAALAVQLVAVGAGSRDTDPLELLRDLLPDLVRQNRWDRGTAATRVLITVHNVWTAHA